MACLLPLLIRKAPLQACRRALESSRPPCTIASPPPRSPGAAPLVTHGQNGSRHGSCCAKRQGGSTGCGGRTVRVTRGWLDSPWPAKHARVQLLAHLRKAGLARLERWANTVSSEWLPHSSLPLSMESAKDISEGCNGMERAPDGKWVAAHA